MLVTALQLKGVTVCSVAPRGDSLPKLKFHLPTSDMVASESPRAFSWNYVTGRRKKDMLAEGTSCNPSPCGCCLLRLVPLCWDRILRCSWKPSRPGLKGLGATWSGVLHQKSSCSEGRLWCPCSVWGEQCLRGLWQQHEP